MEESIPRGTEHSQAPTLMTNLALMLLDRGDSAGAEQLFRRALKLNEGRLNLEEPKVVVMLNNIAMSNLFPIGRYEEVIRLLNLTLDIVNKEFPNNPPPVLATILNNLAWAYQSAGDFTNSAQLYNRTLAAIHTLSATPHPLLATVLRNFSSLRYTNGDTNAAIDLARRAGEIEEQDFDLALAKGSPDQNSTYLSTFQRATAWDISFHMQKAPANQAAARLALTTVMRRKGRVLDAMAGDLRALRDRASQADKGLLNKLSDATTKLAAAISASPDNNGTGYSSEFISNYQNYVKLQTQLSARGRG